MAVGWVTRSVIHAFKAGGKAFPPFLFLLQAEPAWLRRGARGEEIGREAAPVLAMCQCVLVINLGRLRRPAGGKPLRSPGARRV